MRASVGVVGLGRMGTAIAERLIAAQRAVVVWNRTAEAAAPLAERGARVITALPEIWQSAEVVFSCLAGPKAVEDVMLARTGLFATLAPAGRTLVEMSTIDVETSSRVALASREAGVAYLRAPVSGNPSVVRAGRLVIFVSGHPGDLEAVRVLLGDIGSTVTYVGEGERARTVKLAVNLVLGGTAELLAEALVLAELVGIDRPTILGALATSAVGSPFIAYKTPALIADDYESTFTTLGLLKDLDLAHDAAARRDVTLPVIDVVRGLLEECARAGMADMDFMALLPRLREDASLSVA
jgi:3-hydroxyisobutyrate dehydrogenase-like beta-hydroxyacid dehydrogenase